MLVLEGRILLQVRSTPEFLDRYRCIQVLIVSNSLSIGQLSELFLNRLNSAHLAFVFPLMSNATKIKKMSWSRSIRQSKSKRQGGRKATQAPQRRDMGSSVNNGHVKNKTAMEDQLWGCCHLIARWTFNSLMSIATNILRSLLLFYLESHVTHSGWWDLVFYNAYINAPFLSRKEIIWFWIDLIIDNHFQLKLLCLSEGLGEFGSSWSQRLPSSAQVSIMRTDIPHTLWWKTLH